MHVSGEHAFDFVSSVQGPVFLSSMAMPESYKGMCMLDAHARALVCLLLTSQQSPRQYDVLAAMPVPAAMSQPRFPLRSA